MSTRRTHPFLVLVSLFCLLAASCAGEEVVASGSTDNDPASTSDTDPATTANVDLSALINEQDLDRARSTFDAAKSTWQNTEPFAYTMSSGVDSISLIEIDFDADGNASPVRVLQGEEDPEGWAYVPKTVDEAFDELEALIINLETGQWEAGSPGGCDGFYFNASFDANHGVPHYYDTLGPCDDGVGIRITITPEGEDGPVAPLPPCDEGELVGEWMSPRAAGTEPLAPDDGENDEGGIGVIVLTLGDGDSSLRNADTIEIIGEWFCSGTSVIAISDQGEEHEIATINDDGTLEVSGWTLTKAE